MDTHSMNISWQKKLLHFLPFNLFHLFITIMTAPKAIIVSILQLLGLLLINSLSSFLRLTCATLFADIIYIISIISENAFAMTTR